VVALAADPACMILSLLLHSVVLCGVGMAVSVKFKVMCPWAGYTLYGCRVGVLSTHGTQTDSRSDRRQPLVCSLFLGYGPALPSCCACFCKDPPPSPGGTGHFWRST
jgi:hypothetical protein